MNAFERSHNLFAPCLTIQWRRTSGLARLILDKTSIIWEGNAHHTAAWLTRYQNTPLAALRERDFVAIGRAQPAMWGTFITEHTKQLLEILLAADRRIGQNQQSIWLFLVNDRIARRLSSRRI